MDTRTSTEDMDTDCEVSDGNDTQISEGFNEVTEKSQSKNEKNNEYNCSECQSKFKYNLSLSLHIKRTHKEKKAFKCVECNHSFHTSAHLKTHRESVHRRPTISKSGLNESHKNDHSVDVPETKLLFGRV